MVQRLGLHLAKKSPRSQADVDFSNISEHLELRVSARARRMALRVVSHDRKVHLVIPLRASLRKAYEFAYAHQDWINEKIAGIPAPIPFADGVAIPVFDRVYQIKIIPALSRITTIDFEAESLRVDTRLENPSPRIERFLKAHAATELGTMAREKAARLGRSLKTLTVRDMTSRWGSCSIDGRMALSWRLVFAPRIAADYVVAHEAAHLIHPNHSERFWKLCEELSTNFEGGKSWMKINGYRLSRYGTTPYFPPENFEE
jgi:predicted metal-dependent hydrolase